MSDPDLEKQFNNLFGEENLNNKIEDLKGQIEFLREATSDKKFKEEASNYVFDRIKELQEEISQLEQKRGSVPEDQEKINLEKKPQLEGVKEKDVEEKVVSVDNKINKAIGNLEEDFGNTNNSEVKNKIIEGKEIAKETKDVINEVLSEKEKGQIDFNNIENSFTGLHDLFNVLETTTIVNSSGYEYPPQELKEIILAVVEGEADIRTVPRMNGLRDKVVEIKKVVDEEKQKEEKNSEGKEPTGVSKEKIAELREQLKIFKEKREKYLTLKVKLEKNSFHLINNKEREKLLAEYEVVAKEYYDARAEYIGNKANRFTNERLKVAEQEAKILIEDKKSNIIKEKYHKIVDSFYDGYKKLGKINLTDKVFADKLAKKEQDGKTKIVLKALGRFGGKMVSTRLGLSFGLVGGGILLAGSGAGTLAVVPLALRRLLSGTGATIGTYDLQRQFGKDERQAKKVEKMKPAELKKISQADLEKYLNHYEVDASINGNSATENRVYRKLRLEYTQRLRNEQENKKLIENQEIKIDNFLNDKMIEVEEKLDKSKKQAKFRETRRKVIALGMGVFVGSGEAFRIGKKMFFGIKDFLGWGDSKNISEFANSPRLDKKFIDDKLNINKTNYNKIINNKAGAGQTIDKVKVLNKGEIEVGDKITENISVEKIDYQGGKNIWQELSKQIDARGEGSFKKILESFNKEGPALRTYAIDYLKDKIVNNPTAYGLPAGDQIDINNLTTEQLKNIKWDKVISEGLDKVDEMAPELSETAKNSIIENNEIIKNLNKKDLIKDWSKVDNLVQQIKDKFGGNVNDYRLTQKMKEMMKTLKPLKTKFSDNFDSGSSTQASEVLEDPTAQSGVKPEDIKTGNKSIDQTSELELSHKKIVDNQPSESENVDKSHRPNINKHLSREEEIKNYKMNRNKITPHEKKVDNQSSESKNVDKKDIPVNNEPEQQKIKVTEKPTTQSEVKPEDTKTGNKLADQAKLSHEKIVDKHPSGSKDAETGNDLVDKTNEFGQQKTNVMETAVETSATKSHFFKNLENLIGTKYSVGKDGLDCMTLIAKAGKGIKNNILENYESFLKTHSGSNLTFTEFLKDKPVEFRNATWEAVKDKIKPGEYLLNLNSPGGVTYGPEGHGAVLRVIQEVGGGKKFSMIHASTAAVEVSDQELPVSLHEMKIKVGNEEFSGRKIVTSFAKKFKDFMHTASDSSRIYDKALVSKMKFFDKLGHQLHPKLQSGGSLRLGHVTKELDLDSYFKYNKDFSKNITVLKI